jgi:protein-disulfide isomerase
MLKESFVKIIKILAGIVTIAFASNVSFAADAAPTVAGVSPQQQKQIEDVVHQYLIKNPEVIVEAVQALQQKQIDATRKSMKETQETAPKFADVLFRDASNPVAGNVKGAVTIVDFFDYQCPHCSHMTPILDAVIKANPDVRIVFKEFPIRGPISDFASRAALAAAKQGKYFEFHKALMQKASVEPLTEDSIIKAAQSVGLNIDKLKADMKDPSISQQIKDNTKLARDLKLIGTPAFFIGKTNVAANAGPKSVIFIPGQIEQVQLQDIIKQINH